MALSMPIIIKITPPQPKTALARVSLPYEREKNLDRSKIATKNKRQRNIIPVIKYVFLSLFRNIMSCKSSLIF